TWERCADAATPVLLVFEATRHDGQRRLRLPRQARVRPHHRRHSDLRPVRLRLRAPRELEHRVAAQHGAGAVMSGYPSAASSYAGDIDGLILFIAVLVFFWGILVELIFFGFIFKFREKKGQKAQYVTGEDKRQKRWISIPHALV